MTGNSGNNVLQVKSTIKENDLLWDCVLTSLECLDVFSYLLNTDENKLAEYINSGICISPCNIYKGSIVLFTYLITSSNL